MTSIKVRPTSGLQVLDPKTREPLPPEGRDVPRSRYWLRRLAEGDVALVGPPAPLPRPDRSPKPKGGEK